MSFDKDQLIRYSRQLRLEQVGLEGQTKLADAHVAIIGMGGLGCPAASYLAAAGVGQLSLIDHDHIEASNLQRQLLYREADIGLAKATVAARELSSINPNTQCHAIVAKSTSSEAISAFLTADVILDCCDNFDSRYTTNAFCQENRKPLVSGAAIRFEGQLVSFRFEQNKSPCYNCLFPQYEQAVADNCDSAGILPPVVGQIGSAQALEALKIILNLGHSKVILQLFDALNLSWRSLNVSPDPQCTVCNSCKN